MKPDDSNNFWIAGFMKYKMILPWKSIINSGQNSETLNI